MQKLSTHNLTAIGIALIGIITITIGLLLGATPQQARRETRDEQRSQGLSQIQSILTNQFNANARLATAAEYRDLYSQNLLSFGKGHPFSLEPATYRIITDTSFELCTSFETAKNNGGSMAPTTSPVGATYPPSESPFYWSHPIGKTCYTVSISQLVTEQAKQQKLQATQASTTTTP